ncbi:MAG: MFS transporter [Saccharospirillum sp.]|nr:MFS transporter [Saccharospirillum sp.]
MTTSPWVKYALLFFIGFYLRLGALIIPPLIPRLEAMLGFSTSQSALATSLPLLLLAFGALFGGWMVNRLGILKTLILGLLAMAIGSAFRSLPIEFFLFLFATVIMGIGIALMQVGLPSLTRVWLPDNIGRAAAVYTTGLLVGEWIAAGFTGPLVTHLLKDAWRLSFTFWVLPVPLIILALLAYGDRRQVAAAHAAHSKTSMMPDWRDPLLWRVSIVMASSGILYFAGNIFLPPILVETDRVHMLDMTLSALNGVQILFSVLLIFYADRLVGTRAPFYILNSLALLTIPGLLWAPGYWVVFVAGISGALTSAILILALALPAWLVPSNQVARLSAGMLFIGYTLVFFVPVVGGWLNDLTGLRALAFLPTVVVALLAMASVGGIERRVQSEPSVSSTIK